LAFEKMAVKKVDIIKEQENTREDLLKKKLVDKKEGFYMVKTKNLQLQQHLQKALLH